MKRAEYESLVYKDSITPHLARLVHEVVVALPSKNREAKVNQFMQMLAKELLNQTGIAEKLVYCEPEPRPRKWYKHTSQRMNNNATRRPAHGGYYVLGNTQVAAKDKNHLGSYKHALNKYGGLLGDLTATEQALRYRTYERVTRLRTKRKTVTTITYVLDRGQQK